MGRSIIKIDFEEFKKLYPISSGIELKQKFGLNKSQLNNVCQKLKLRRPEGYKKILPSQWSKEHLDFLTNNFRTLSFKEIGKHIGKKTGAISSMAFKLKLKRTEKEQYAIDLKYNTGLLKKGNISWNKGTKGLTGPNKTSFKKGHVPAQTKSDNTISIRKDQSGTAYKYIRISKGRWELLSRYNWQKEFGEIPEGHIVAFKDGNSMNIEPADCSNLVLITYEQNMERNSIHRFPEELKSTIRVLSKIKKQLYNHEKQN